MSNHAALILTNFLYGSWGEVSDGFYKKFLCPCAVVSAPEVGMVDVILK